MNNRNAEHPSAEIWELLACDELDARQAAQVHTHMETCDDCTLIWQALGDVRAAAAAFDPSLASSPPTAKPAARPSGAGTWFGLAAAVIAVVGLSLLSGRLSQTQVPLEVSEPPAIERSHVADEQLLITPSEGEVVTQAVFVWRAMLQADRYRVDLFDAEGTLVWQSGNVTQTRLEWPAEVPAIAGSYFWRVVTWRGELRQSSELVGFTMRSDDEVLVPAPKRENDAQ